MKPFIVVADGFDKNLFDNLCATPELNVHPEAKISQEKLKELLPKINGLIIRSATTVSEEYLNFAPNLKLIIRAGEGTDNIDKKACQERGVMVENTPGANSNSAAEHAVALMMTVLRKTAWAHSSTSQGKWEKSKFSGNELTGKTVGILGFGRIGQLVGKRLQGFDPNILFFDNNKDADHKLPNTRYADPEEIFSEADIISIHLPLLDSTRGMVNKTLLSKMRPEAVLINAARGGIVNEKDLFEAIDNEKIRAAGFDVFEKEPIEKNHPFLNHPNIVLTPHLGASTEEAQKRVGEMALQQIQEFFINGKVLNQVKP